MKQERVIYLSSNPFFTVKLLCEKKKFKHHTKLKLKKVSNLYKLLFLYNKKIK